MSLGGRTRRVKSRLEGKALKQGWSHDAQLEAFVAYAPVAMAMLDLDMRYVATSERWLSDHGLDRSPVGLLHYDVFPEIPEAWRATLRRCLGGATESSQGDPFPRADGRVQWVKWSAGPWRDREGNVGGVILTAEDITARKEAEAEVERLASIVRHSSDAIFAQTLDSIVTSWNPGAARLLGYSAEEMIGRSIVRIIPADRLGEEDRILERIRADQAVEPFETQRVARDGSVLDVSLSIAAVRDARGAIVGASKILRDVTRRRKTEEALRASEERFRALVEEAPDAILLIDLDPRRVIAANKAAERLFAVSRDEIFKRDPLSFYTPEQPDGRPAAESFAEHGEQALAGEEVTFERLIRRPSGEERLARVTVVRLPSASRLVRVSLVDVTEQDRTRRELASTGAILAAEHDSSPDGIFVIDPTGRVLSVNRRFAEIFGVPLEMFAAGDYEAVRERAFQQVTDAETFIRSVRRLRSHPDESAGDELHLEDGRILDFRASPFRTPDGEFLGRIWFFRDVTESRKAEEALRTSEERFRTLIEDAPDAILLFDMDKGAYVAANKAVERLFGVSRDELLGQEPSLPRSPDQLPHSVTVLQRFYAPEQPDGLPLAQSFREYAQRALAGEEVTFERRLRRPSGEERIARATVVRLPSRARLLRTSLVDITEQDRVRRELASTAAILETEHESSPDGILVVDPTGRIVSFNRRLVEMFHLPQELIAAREYEVARALAVQQAADVEAVARRAQYLYDHPEETAQDELLLKDGRVLDRWTSPFRTADGEALGRIWFHRDITERRKAEDALRASEERFRMLVEEAPDAILLHDADQGCRIAANKAAERLFGVSRDEILGYGPLDFYAPEQPDGRPPEESLAEHLERALAGEEVTYERRILLRSGEQRLARVTLVRLPSKGRLLRVSLVDITEQDRALRDLAYTAAILATEHESSPDGILIVDSTRRFISCNSRFREMFDVPPERLSVGLETPQLTLVREQALDPEAFQCRIAQIFAHPDEPSYDELALKNGRIVDRIGSPFKTPEDGYLGRIWFFRDITERKHAEDALRASEERLRLLVEGAPDAILLYDVDKDVYIAANKAAERLFGISRDELLRQEPQRARAPKQLDAAPGPVSVLQRVYPPEQPDGLPLAQSFREYRERALAGEEVTFERRIRRPSGEVRLARATVVRLPSHFRLLRTSLVDITEQDRAQRELASTVAILATEHESSPDGILVVDTTSSDRVPRIISVNRRLAEIFVVPDEVLAARDYPALRSKVSQQVTDAEAFVLRVQFLYENPDQTFHDELLLKDDRVIDRLSAPFRTPDGATMGRITFFHDITERRRAEDALRASEERFRTLIEEAPDAILLYDVDQGRLVSANKAAERLFGASRDEIARRGPQSFYAPEQPDGRPSSESFPDHNGRALAGEDVTFERWIRRPTGEVRICSVRLVRLSATSRLLRSSLVDITDQRAAEAQVSEILRGTVALQEAERRRIARELHDSLNQYLAALTMKLELFAQGLSESSPFGPAIAELKGLTGAVGDEVSRLAWELRPIALDDIGLEAAIQRLIDEWAQRSNLRIDLDLALNGRRLPPEVEVNLYRVLQEGLTNIVKHAGAGRVGVIATASRDGVVMIIEDDGKGFDPETVNRGSSPHFGLLGMRERLALVGGSLEIETRPGGGTTLIVRAPVKESVKPT